MNYTAHVEIVPKPSILDPQGRTIKEALLTLGYEGVSDVKIGKLMEIRLNAQNRPEAYQAVDEMCRRLLANPVIEEYRFEIREE